MSLKQVITCPSLLSKLEEAGYINIQELENVNIFSLTKELSLTKQEVQCIIQILNNEGTVQPTQTIADRITLDKGYSISTSSSKLDELIDKGIPPMKISEICGASGAGKTQICMQLAINVQLPKESGGLGGECVYIDTEGSFSIYRLMQMLDNHEDRDTILKSIHVYRVLDHVELVALILQLPEIVANRNIKLIVLDSIAIHFRLNVMNAHSRTMILNYIAQSLLQVANRHQLAVVITNHVTIGMDNVWIPSLGTLWGQWCAIRLFIFRKKQQRYGYLYKSMESPSSKYVSFTINDRGISDPTEEVTGHGLFEDTDELWNIRVKEDISDNDSLSGSIHPVDEDNLNVIHHNVVNNDITMDMAGDHISMHSDESVLNTYIDRHEAVNMHMETMNEIEEVGGNDVSSSGYWSSDIEDDIRFLINMSHDEYSY